MKTKIHLIIILLFSGTIRLIFLNKIPIGINNDELHFVMNAKSIFYNFTNLEGKINPLQLSEISSLIFSPIIGPLSNNLFTARLPYAIVGILSCLLIYLITLKFTKNNQLALISGLIMSLNPWSIYVSRTSFDAPIAIFLYLLTIYLLMLSKPKYILLSILTAFLAFHSYIGTKIIYFPIVLLSSLFLWKHNKQKNSTAYAIVIFFSLVTTINFIIKLPVQLVGDRLSELQTPNSQIIKNQVELERRQSLQIPFLKVIFTNKYTIYFRNFIQKYLYNFSTDILFINGDHTSTGSLWKHGYFYYIDFFLIIIGLVFLYNKYKFFLFFIISLICLSPLPEAVRADKNPSYIFHSSFQFPLICIIVAAGVLYLLNKFTKTKLSNILVVFYLLSFINFVDIYFFKAPIYQPEAFRFSQRLLSKYLQLETEKNRQIFVLTQEPEVSFRSYLFYTNYYQKNKVNFIKEIYSKPTDNITFKNIHFINHQKYLPNTSDFTLIYDSINFAFNSDESKIHISNLSDTGKIYSINRGLTCQNLILLPYPNNTNLKDLSIENLNELDYCQKYLTI